MTPQEIFSETNLVLGDKDLSTLQSELEMIKAERDLLLTQNTILNDKVVNMERELELMKKDLSHKDELLALHSYYKKQIENFIRNGMNL